MSPSHRVRAGLALALAASAAASALAVTSHAPRLEPGSAAWRRLVLGATASGVVHEHATLSLPGLDRSAPQPWRLRLEPPHAVVRLACDRGAVQPVRADRNGEAVVVIPAASAPGARLDLLRDAAQAPPRIREVSRLGRPRPAVAQATALALLVGLASALFAARPGLRLGAALACLLGALLLLAACPALLLLGFPGLEVLPRLLIPVVWLAVSLALVHAAPADRRLYWAVAGLLSAAVFGGWVRWSFLPSAGSWDTEYWKGWTMWMASHGVTQVYGGPDAVGEGRFAAQLLGREPLWQVPYEGRELAVDYPPLAMALWRASWSVVTGLMPWWSDGEARNVAVKLPALLGDLGAVLLLVLVLRRRPWRALTLAALYWALPVSWLSSAVLGFLDGAYVPLAVAALVAAGAGRAGWAGALLVLAALVKPQGAIVAPAVGVALWTARASLARAGAAGLAVLGATLLPFLLAATLDEAVVHVFRVLSQERLSGGFANPWWVLGHLLEVAREGPARLTLPVAFVRIDAAPFPARALALLLFGAATLGIAWAQRLRPGARAACLSGSLLFLSYALFALGVHHNHPHLVLLALAAGGLHTRRSQLAAAAFAASYVLNLAVLEGLGRFYGPRYQLIEPWSAAVSGLRLALGFDLTLLLAVVNLLVYCALLSAWAPAARAARGEAG